MTELDVMSALVSEEHDRTAPVAIRVIGEDGILRQRAATGCFRDELGNFTIECDFSTQERDERRIHW